MAALAPLAPTSPTAKLFVIARLFDFLFMRVTGTDSVGYHARYPWDRAPCWADRRETAVLGCRQRWLASTGAGGGFNLFLQIIGAGLGLAGTFLIGAKDPLGFWLYLGSNAALVWLHLRVRLKVLLLLHVTYFALAVYGLVNWSR